MLLLKYIPKGKIAPASLDDDEEYVSIPEFLFGIEAIDVDSGLKHCGSREAYMSTLEMYLDAAPKNMDDIKKYWATRDLKNTTVKIHALKSTSRLIGAVKLGDFAARLEKAGEAGDAVTLEREISDLLKQYSELVKELEPLNDIKDDDIEDDRAVISHKDIKNAYTDILEFCNSFDYDSVGNMVENLEKYRFPEDEASRFVNLKKAVDNFDYDLIPEILSEKEGK